MSISTYWLDMPTEEQELARCYYGISLPFDSLPRHEIEFELNYSLSLKPYQRTIVMVKTLDKLIDLLIDWPAKEEGAWCRITVYAPDPFNDKMLEEAGCGEYRKSNDGERLIECNNNSDETYDAHGLADAINETWRKRGGK